MRNPLAVERRAANKERSDCNPAGITLKGSIIATAVTAALCFATITDVNAEPPATSPPATAAAAAPATVKPAAVTAAEARGILLRMAEFMASTRSYSVDVRGSYDVLQKSGQKIEFSQVRKITLVRPDRLRVDVEDSNGDKSLVIYDGKNISMSSPLKNVYAQVAKPGTIDDAIVYYVRDLGMRLPLAALMVSDAPGELDRRTQTLEYVEKTSIFGSPAHHLAGRTDSVDYQIWITDGDRPLPQRVVLTYRKEKGQPQFRAQFAEWNLAPQAPASVFEFTPPPGSHQIAFLAQLPRMAATSPKGGKSKKSGGKK